MFLYYYYNAFFLFYVKDLIYQLKKRLMVRRLDKKLEPNLLPVSKVEDLVSLLFLDKRMDLF